MRSESFPMGTGTLIFPPFFNNERVKLKIQVDRSGRSLLIDYGMDRLKVEAMKVGHTV